jgi:hypothetical protein
MDLSKLNANERLAFWGAVISIAGAVLAQIGFTAGGLWLTLILALAMIVVIFLPQWSPQSQLPGSKGTLMLIVGGIAGIGAILGLLGLFGAFALLGFAPLWAIGLLVGIIGGLVMAWAGWQEFQAEGGRFQLGTPGAASAGTTAAPPPAAAPPPPAPAPPPAAAQPPPAPPPPSAAPPSAEAPPPPPAAPPPEPSEPRREDTP